MNNLPVYCICSREKLQLSDRLTANAREIIPKLKPFSSSPSAFCPLAHGPVLLPMASTSATAQPETNETGARVESLVDWVTIHGAELHPGVEVYHDPGTGLSFRVKDQGPRVKPGEAVVSIPAGLTLSYLNALSDSGPRALPSRLLANAPPHVVGRLFLAKEYLAGRDSFWWPYIQALPQPVNVDSWALPPFWPPDEADLLEGTNLEVGIRKVRADVDREWSEAEGLVSDLALTVDLYRWAYCIFSSRSFRPALVLSERQRQSLPDGVSLDHFSVLLPFFDIGNHDMRADVCWELDDAAQSCHLRVGRAHDTGEQIFNNYGMKTNAELLLGYGFMVPATGDLHNDYAHVRRRGAGSDAGSVAAGDCLISLRPLADPSSVLIRSRQRDSVPLMGAFSHLQPDMVWDIFCALVPLEQRSCLLAGDDDDGEVGEAREAQFRRTFLSGRVPEEVRPWLEQTVAVIQHKLLQELDRLEESDFEVTGGPASLLRKNQRQALAYRQACRRVLENALEAVSRDEIVGDVATAKQQLSSLER